MKYRLAPAALTASLLFAPAVFANDYADQLRNYAETELSNWLNDQTLLSAIAAQNADHGGLSPDDINGMDQTWRAEVGAGESPMIDRVLASDASARLRSLKDSSEGLITEVFIMDNLGLNVAQSDITSDFWQGDEAKFQDTYGVGVGAIHLGDVEFDESSQTYQSQISMTISDPASGAAIGAITFGIDVGMFD